MRKLLGLGTVLVVVAGMVPMVGLAQSSEGFTDVPDGHVFAADIDWLATEGITKGCNPPANSLFCPEDDVTRGQMAAFLVRALGLESAGPQGLTDTADSVFEADIDALAAAGITKGCNPPDNSLFCPEDPVTRGQMAAFLVRALGLEAAGSQGLTDTAESVFEADIDALAAAGITKGCNPPENDEFCPDDPVTRGQMAAFLRRALETTPVEQLVVTTESLPTAVASEPYSHQLEASGGIPPYVWSVSGLPAGLAGDPSGEISGETTELGSFTVDVTVTASDSTVADATFALDVETELQITAGSSHTCGVDTNGDAYCWGLNVAGQNGDGETGIGNSVPTSVDTTEKFTAIGAGLNHSCGLGPAGDAYCWGDNFDGQLGNDDATNDSSVPVAVDTTERFSVLSVRHNVSCGLNTAGVAFCWGDNSNGQLGDDNDPTDSPVPVEVATSERFTALATGIFHSCAIATTGDAYCWGDNFQGQLGDGNDPFDSPVPVEVDTAETFTAITVGAAHTCGLTTIGKAFCWGDNGDGQLGDDNEPEGSPVPVEVDTTETFTAITSGEDHTCGITTTGDVFCWGNNDDGKLGDDNADTNSPVPVAVDTTETFTSLTSGYDHTCGITTTGDAYCWGVNDYGELGDGEGPAASHVPTQVIGFP